MNFEKSQHPCHALAGYGPSGTLCGTDNVVILRKTEGQFISQSEVASVGNRHD